MTYALARSVERVEQSILSECDAADDFCDMLKGWLDQHKHWMANGYSADLINQVSDYIDENRGQIQKGREDAAQDAHDTVGDAKREYAA